MPRGEKEPRGVEATWGTGRVKKDRAELAREWQRRIEQGHCFTEGQGERKKKPYRQVEKPGQGGGKGMWGRGRNVFETGGRGESGRRGRGNVAQLGVEGGAELHRRGKKEGGSQGGKTKNMKPKGD